MRDEWIYYKDLLETTGVNSLLRIIKVNKIMMAINIISKYNNESSKKIAQEIIARIDEEIIKLSLLK